MGAIELRLPARYPSPITHDQIVFDAPLVFLDVETTGGSAARDRITEIGLVELDHGRPAGEWSTLVNPLRSIPPAIQVLTGITDAMVSRAPPFADVAPTLHARLAGKLLVAHNARFDYAFLRHEFQRAGLRYSSRVLCTVKLSRKLYPGHARHNLDSLIARHRLHCAARHRALGDARTLWRLLVRWQEEIGAAAVAAAAAKLAPAPRLPAGLPEGALDDIPDGPGAYLFRGEGTAVLYVGRNNNLRAGVTAHFAAGRATARSIEIAQRVQRIDWIETAGELSARIEAARLVKQLAPMLNRPARRPGTEATRPWPFRGRIGVRERGAEALMVLDQWRYLGLARSEVELHELAECRPPEFDPETCRLLARFFSGPRRGYEVVDLAALKTVTRDSLDFIRRELGKWERVAKAAKVRVD